MKLSIKGKIKVLVIIPIIAIFVLTALIFIKDYRVYSSAGHLRSNIPTLVSMSSLVGSLQKERGMSATYLSGGITRDAIYSQRSATDKLLAEFNAAFETSYFSEQETKNAKLLNLSDMRSAVDNKSDSSIVLKGYTEIIYSLLDLYSLAINDTTLTEFKTLLENSRIIEEAKESSGKLRANMSKTLAANKPINNQTLSVLLKLKAGVDISLKSPVLELDAKSLSMIDEFYNSGHWKDVNETFSLILSKMKIGDYGRDGGEFFSVISKSVRALGELVEFETSILAENVDKIHSEIAYELVELLVIISVAVLIIVALSIKISLSIAGPLDLMSSRLDNVSDEVNQSSALLSDMGRQITERATSQASAIEETSASVEELVAMVDSNLEYSELSANKTREISSISEKGRLSADQLLVAMNEINESNRSITNIIGLIGEIAEKTKVIDEIVFQTKLLSFNASVEAERAGEHGRGFAVVAQEVGNLASMSGKAASEISQIVSKSVEDVNKVIDENGQKVKNGSTVAESAAEVFMSIEKHSAEAASMSDKILSASREQTLGLKQINEAITQLDRNTQESVITAEEMADSGQKLDKSSSSLRVEVEKLLEIVRGRLSKI